MLEFWFAAIDVLVMIASAKHTRNDFFHAHPTISIDIRKSYKLMYKYSANHIHFYFYIH